MEMGPPDNSRTPSGHPDTSRTPSGPPDTSRTPSSAPRVNPFDSQVSMDQLHLPTCSPSVFSIVVSPSQEIVSESVCLCFIGGFTRELVEL
jgi:hypothetical protein